MNNRSRLAKTAEETLAILAKGYYMNRAGRQVSIASALSNALAHTRLYYPGDSQIEMQCRKRLQSLYHSTNIRVTNETTLHAARDAAAAGERILCLNFASARNPGGGFLKGSQAQEESLARASGLYPCLMQMTDYYNVHKQQKSGFYTDHMIYSPDVPVFRDDHNVLLENFYQVSFLTAPAVNRGAVERNEPHLLFQVYDRMQQRIEKMLSLCVVQEHSVLVLGAWGCGVFKNKPEEIAGIFRSLLLEKGTFARAFKLVIFAVLDNSKELNKLTAFKTAFKPDRGSQQSTTTGKALL